MIGAKLVRSMKLKNVIALASTLILSWGMCLCALCDLNFRWFGCRNYVTFCLPHKDISSAFSSTVVLYQTWQSYTSKLFFFFSFLQHE